MSEEESIYGLAVQVFDDVNNSLYKKAIKAKKTELKKLSLDQVLASDSEFTELTLAAQALCRRLRLRSSRDNAVYINGAYYHFTPVSYRRQLVEVYSHSIQYLQQRVGDFLTSNIYDVLII
jgi:hypothetical protein